MKMSFKEKTDFPKDADKDGVIVMPVNLQGLLELGRVNRKFKHRFPITSKLYLKDCILGECFVGDVKLYEEDGYKIALLFYKTFEVGAFVENDVKLDLQMVMCLIKLLNKFPEGTRFYSPVIPFVNAQMKIVHSQKNDEWVVLREDKVV